MKNITLLLLILFAFSACKPEIEEIEPVEEYSFEEEAHVAATKEFNTFIDEGVVIVVEIEDEAQFAGIDEELIKINSTFDILPQKQLDSLIKLQQSKEELKTNDKK